MGMVVPFPKPERSWRASLLIFLVDCWSKKSASSSGSRGTVSSSIWALFRLLDLLSLRLPLAHLAQSIARQSSSCKDMQNSQVLSREQTLKQALILQFWQWVRLSPSPSLNGPDKPLNADLLGGLLVEKKSSSSGLRDTASSSICTLSRLLDLLSLHLLMAHLAQSMALQSSPYKDMQNSQVLSREQTPKQALILQFWQWLWLSPSPSLNGPDEPPCWSSWWTAGRKKSSSGLRDTVSSSIWALSRLLDLHSLHFSLAHLAQSMARQSSSCKDMQNSQVLSWEQTARHALIIQFWQWVWLSPSPSLNGPDEPPCWSSWWTAGRKNPIIIRLERHCILVHLGPPPISGLALLATLICTFRPIHGPPILVLQKYAKLPSVVTRTNTQTSLDCTVLVMSMVVPFPAELGTVQIPRLLPNLRRESRFRSVCHYRTQV